MLLRNVGNENWEQGLNCVLFGGFVLRSVQIVRHIPSLLFIVEGGESLQKVVVLFHAVVGHVFVPEFKTQISQNFPPVRIHSIDSYLFYDKIFQKYLSGRVGFLFNDFCLIPPIKILIGDFQLNKLIIQFLQ